MADALLSPAVGGAMWAASAGAIACSARKVHEKADDSTVPLMGVVGAFVFAAQMVNFTIPGTGSSGHLGGGLLLAVLLGPHAAFLVMASVLIVQALFFADGGLLALGANVFNLGVFPCFVAYPLLYRPLAGETPSKGRIALGSLVAGVASLQLGALGVVLETVLSGVSELPFSSFLLLMQPIHLAIGVVEGLATAAVVSFVWKTQPEILAGAEEPGDARSGSGRRVLVLLGVAALVVGAGLSWFASTHPDGLEWSIARITGSEEVETPEGSFYSALERLQEKLSFLPDYGFRSAEAEGAGDEAEDRATAGPGTSMAGVVGGLLTLLTAGAVGWLLKRRASTA